MRASIPLALNAAPVVKTVTNFPFSFIFSNAFNKYSNSDSVLEVNKSPYMPFNESHSSIEYLNPKGGYRYPLLNCPRLISLIKSQLIMVASTFNIHIKHLDTNTCFALISYPVYLQLNLFLCAASKTFNKNFPSPLPKSQNDSPSFKLMIFVTSLLRDEGLEYIHSFMPLLLSTISRTALTQSSSVYSSPNSIVFKSNFSSKESSLVTSLTKS